MTKEIKTSKITNVETKKRDRNSTKEIIDFVLSRPGIFTIYDVYNKFPGKKSAVQMVIAVVGLSGLLQKIKRGEYRVAADKVSENIRISQLEEENHNLYMHIDDMFQEIEVLRGKLAYLESNNFEMSKNIPADLSSSLVS